MQVETGTEAVERLANYAEHLCAETQIAATLRALAAERDALHDALAAAVQAERAACEREASDLADGLSDNGKHGHAAGAERVRIAIRARGPAGCALSLAKGESHRLRRNHAGTEPTAEGDQVPAPAGKARATVR